MIPISVCMAMYNASRYLRECIDSILKQTFTDFELLIVDDGSTDDSCDIVRSYNDPRIRLIRNKHDYIGSLNILLAKARGKYIARMDADDVMLPHRLERQFMYMEQYRSVDVLGAAAGQMSSSTDEFVWGFNEEKEITVQDLLKSNRIIHPAIFMRTASLRKNNLKYEHAYIYAEDYRLWTRYIMSGLVMKVIPDVVVKYRRYDEQVTSRYANLIPEIAERIQLELGEWFCRKHHKAYRNPQISNSNNKVTAIIPFLNEGKEVAHTVESLRKYVGYKIDIIVINDCSTDGYPYKKDLDQYGVYYILNRRRKGVAASRDIGVNLCKTPYFILLDAHMRVYEGDWLSAIEALLEQNDRQLLCMQTKVLYKDDEGRVVEADNKEVPITYGAYHPFNLSSYLPDIKWNTTARTPEADSEEIAIVLGAGYAGSKRYWTYLKGLKGLLYYGSDEAYISMKVWMEGGKCVLLKKHVFGHVYRKKSPYQHYIDKNVYNCLLIACSIYPLHYRSWVYAAALVKDIDVFYRANNLLRKRKKFVNELKTYYERIFNVSFYDVLSIHRFSEKNIDTILHVRTKLLPDVMAFITQKTNEDYGLYYGIAGEVIWLMHYERFASKNLSMYWEPLLDRIDDAVLTGKLPINFSYGLCGIGWMYIYLYSKGFIPYPNMKVIEYIDGQLQTINFEKMEDYSFGTGIGGILCYLYSRLYNQTLECTLTANRGMMHGIQRKIRTILRKTTDIHTVFNAFRYMETEKSSVNHEYINNITDCLVYPESLSTDMQYWNSSLYNGCTGYTLQCMTITRN